MLNSDTIAILNDSGECVAEYSYDAWGNCTVTKATDTIAYDNPLRYRGYYYDFDSGLYYLQSRFYDANTGRFINADEPTLIGANGGVVSNNLFAYCDNNPVMKSDPDGHFVLTTTLVIAILYVFANILLCYSIYANYDSWVKFCTAVGNGLDSAWKSLKKGASSVWRWSKSKLKLLKAQLTNYLTSAKADATIRSKVKRNSKTRYWSATLRNGHVDLGRRLSLSEAVKEVRKGKSVFTVTRAEARALAKKAGNNKKPVGPEIDKGKNGVVGYYFHYHTYNRNGAHIWFLY